MGTMLLSQQCHVTVWIVNDGAKLLPNQVAHVAAQLYNTRAMNKDVVYTTARTSVNVSPREYLSTLPFTPTQYMLNAGAEFTSWFDTFQANPHQSVVQPSFDKFRNLILSHLYDAIPDSAKDNGVLVQLDGGVIVKIVDRSTQAVQMLFKDHVRNYIHRTNDDDDHELHECLSNLDTFASSWVTCG